MCLGGLTLAIAVAPVGVVVGNVGRFDFDQLPHTSPMRWNLQNYEYPPGALRIEDLGGGNRALRVGKADGSQRGRLTISLTSITHDWNPSDPGATHVVSVRMAARYSGAAFVAVSSPGGRTVVDIGRGRLKVAERKAGRDLMVDETDAVQAALEGRWSAAELHTYTIQWKTTGQRGRLPFELHVDGKLVKRFIGWDLPLDADPVLSLSLEYGSGTGLIDFVSWRLNDGRPKVRPPLVVRPGVHQLFLDDFGIEHMEGLRRVVNQPRKHPNNPVLVGDHPWEARAVSVYGTAMYDARRKRFRMWYLCIPGPPPSGCKWLEVGGYRRVTHCTLLAYAESEDGVHWVKPVLGQLSFEGSKQNNLIDIGMDNPEGVSVLFDPHDPDPQRRYKALFWDRRLTPPDDPAGVDQRLAAVPKQPPGYTAEQLRGGMWAAFSADGIRWKTVGPVMPVHSDTSHAVLWDARIGKYVAFSRFGFGRQIARAESADFLHWSRPKLVLHTDVLDGPGGQIYGMPTDFYEGLYLGMFWMYHEGTTAKIDTQLAVSRDGIHWHRVADRQTFLPNGPEGSRDDGMARVATRYILRPRGPQGEGETIYLYYSMVNGPHRSPKFPKPVRKYRPAIGLATLRRDGFVSLDASDQPGTLLTRPFQLLGSELYVNLDTNRGALRVAVLDPSGRPYPGFGASLPLAADTTRARVRWAGAELARLRGKIIQLRFTLRRGKLFAYWVE